MESFKIIYKILRQLEKSMSLEEIDKNNFTAEHFKVSEPYFARIMKLLVDNDYISGVDVWISMDTDYPKYCLIRPEITLKGLEYLNENSLMKKAAELAKGAVGLAGSTL